MEIDCALNLVLASNDVAIAYLDVRCNGEYWVVTGSSRRTPGDRPNKEVGMALAISRAYERFARQLARQANGAVENNDWVQQDHRARAAAKMKVAKKTAVAKKRAAAKKGKK
jgi:hypothetical protein